MGALKIDKPIRLIELFAGIGSQAKALKRLGADFEHYRICEFDKYAIKSYNAIHGTDFETSDITELKAKDLGIVDTDKYCYIMTYSFPCQDLSLAGKGKGMARGANTRSGLLWEVERLLDECEELPQILLMENVTQVHGKKNKEHFDEWIAFLESKGYRNFWQDLNAKNYGIPQNRNRCFMVSVLGDYTYTFPKEFPLELRLKDMLETEVDEKFYLSDAMINFFTENTKRQAEKGNGFRFQPTDGNCVGKAVTTRAGGRMDDNFIKSINCQQTGILVGGKWDKMHDVSRRVYSEDGVSPTIHTCGGGNTEPKVLAGIGEKKSNGGTQWYQQDRIYDDKVAISVTTAFNPYYAVKNTDPFICASRGRNPENPSDRTAGIHTEQRLEPNFSGCSNTLTTVQKDNYVAVPLAYDEQNRYIRKDGCVGTLTTDGSSPKHNNRVIENARIRKLTPKECWRLMGFDDEDFEKAEKVNSNTQLYKQAGNSIVVDVLYYIFREML